MKPIFQTVILACALGATAARADDENEVKVPEANVPKVVLDAVTKKFPTATSRSFEKELKGTALQYEAELEVKDGARVRKVSVEVSAQGVILSEEELISFDALPTAVKSAHQASRYGRSTIEAVEREIKGGKTTYEIAVKGADGKRELVYDSQGALVKDKDRGENGDKR